MIHIMEKSGCCGCTACVNVCPTHCIEMKKDEEGFAYPEVVQEDCIKCGLCERVCPMRNPYSANDKVPIAYAAVNQDETVRLNSSSGGIFLLLAGVCLAGEGKVYGAAFDKDWKVTHMAVEDADGLWRLRGSKYLQSELGNTFALVKQDLECGRKVLFSGTPCQVAGLKRYLGDEQDNLCLVDVVCHGVPSPLVWEKYLDYRKMKQRAEPDRESSPSFRSKTEGWTRFSVSIPFSHDTEYRMEHSKDLYMKTFLQNKNLRPSCYHCNCKPSTGISDITLADFWGINHFYPEMNDDKGTSLVLVNSDKGKEMFEKISSKIWMKEVGYEEVTGYNPAILHSVRCPLSRKRFFQELSWCDAQNMGKWLEGITRESKVELLEKRIWGKIRRAVVCLSRDKKAWFAQQKN